MDASQALSALDETGDKAKETTGSFGNLSKSLKNFGNSLKTSTFVKAVSDAVKYLWEMVTASAELAREIDVGAQKMGFSTKAYQEWTYVGKILGVEMSQIASASMELSKKVGEGSEDTMAALEEIGVSVADAMTAVPEELFNMVIAGLQGVESFTRRAALADTLLGGAAEDLTPLLNSNGEEVEDLKKKYESLGGAMDDNLIEKEKDFQNALTNLNTAWTGVKNHLLTFILPPLTEAIKGITTLLTDTIPNAIEKASEKISGYLGWVKDEATAAQQEAEKDVLAALEEAAPGSTAGATSFKELEQKTGETWMSQIGMADEDENALDALFVNDAEGVHVGRTWDEGDPLGLQRTVEYNPELGAQKMGEFFKGLHIGNFFGSMTEGDAADAIEEAYKSGAIDFRAYLEGQLWQTLDEDAEAWLEGIADAYDAAKENEDAEGMEAAIEEFFNGASNFGIAAADAETELVAIGDASIDSKADILGLGDAANNAAASMNSLSALQAAAFPSALWRIDIPDVAGAKSHASGIQFVPRDDYPAKLHYGERVLTRQEAAEYNAGSGGQQSTTIINIQSVAQSPAEEAAAITAALQRARWAM